MYDTILYTVLRLPISHCACEYSFNYGYNNQTRFVYIFQTEHFSAVKVAMSNVTFLVTQKSPKV